MLFSLSCFPLQRLLIDKCHKVFGLWRNTYITPLDGTIAAAMLPKNTQSENYRKTDSHPGLEGTLRNHLVHLYVLRKMEVLLIFKDSQLLVSFLQDPLKGFAAERGQREDSVLDTWKPGI